MSSTNRRSDRREHEADYYVTPKEPIRQVSKNQPAQLIIL